MQTEIIELFEEQLRGWALVTALANRNLNFQEDRLRRQMASSHLTPAVRAECDRIASTLVANREKVNESLAQISNARDRLDQLREIELPPDFNADDIDACLLFLRTGQ